MSSLFGDAVEWRASRAILAQAVVERRAKGSLTLSWILLVLASLGVLALSSDSPHRLVLFAFFTGVPLAMFFLMWWIYVLSSIVQQCSTPAAALLPALPARTRRVMLWCWTGIVLAMALVLGLPSGRPVLVAILTGLLLIELGVLGNVKRFAVIVAAIVVYKYAGRTVSEAVLTFMRSPGAEVLGLAVLLFNGRAALRRRFVVGEERRAFTQHALDDPSDERVASALSPNRSDPQRAASLNRLLGAAPLRQPLFLRELGPSAFGHYYAITLLLLLACGAIRGWHAWRSETGAEEGLFLARGLLLLFMLMLQALLVHTEATRFERRRVEQALLRLTPVAPGARQMNRVLAVFWRVGLAQMWTSCTLATLAGMLALGASRPELGRALAACTLSLLLAGLVFRDYARGRIFGNLGVLVLGGYTIAACAAAGMTIADSRHDLPWLRFGLVVTSASLIFAWWRWRRMLGAPAALPSGRHA